MRICEGDDAAVANGVIGAFIVVVEEEEDTWGLDARGLPVLRDGL